jgi:RES domain-containing protein
MILTHLKSEAYRMHVPKWAVAPTSGAGAGTYGGRANRIGVEALYLSLDALTALAEYQQTSALLPPGLMVAYQIDVYPIVDFREGYNPKHWGPLWKDFFCDWRSLFFNRRIEPPSWEIGDEVIAAGAKGIMFQSVLTRGTNVVLYTAELADPESITIYDPSNDLPKNQDSWS